MNYIVQEAYDKLPISSLVTDDIIHTIAYNLQLPKKSRVLDAELVSHPSRMDEVTVNYTIHDENQLHARIVEVNATFSQASNKRWDLMELKMRDISQVPIDIVELVNTLHHRPQVQYRLDFPQPTPLEYPHPFLRQDVSPLDDLLKT